MKKQRNIVFIVDHIAKEGTSKMVTYLVNGLSEYKEFNVSIIQFHNNSVDFGEKLSDKVKVHSLALNGSSRAYPIRILRKISSLKPTIVFVCYTQHMPFMALLCLPLKICGTKLLFRETIIPSLFRKETHYFKRLCFGFLYNIYDKIIAQSNDMRDDLINNWYVDSSRIVVINNPIKNAEKHYINQNISTSGIYHPLHFVAVGRLEAQKGYDLLLERMAELPKDQLFYVDILGEGSLYENIKKTISAYGLEGYVTLKGFQKDSKLFMSKSDGLLLPSRYEGFPNVVLEANSLGKPVFANICLGGINEIILDNINGISCDFTSSKSFVEGLKTFRSTKFVPEKIIQITNQRYSYSKILSEYYELLAGV